VTTLASAHTFFQGAGAEKVDIAIGIVSFASSKSRRVGGKLKKSVMGQ
jgi:hypothetical protein